MRIVVIMFLISANILLSHYRSFAERQDSVDSVQRTVDKIVDELSYSLKMNRQLIEERTQLKQEVEGLIKTKQTLQRDLAGLKEKEASFSGYQETLKEYQNNLAQSKDKIKELERLKASLETKLGEYEEIKKVYQEAEKKLEVYTDLQKELESYKAVSSQLEEALSEDKTKVAQTKSKVAELEKLRASLEEKLNGYESKVSEDENKIQDLVKELDSYRAKLTQSQDKIQELEETLQINQQAKEKIRASTEEELEELKDALSSKDKELEEYKTSLVQTDDNLETLIVQMNTQRRRAFESFYEAGKAYALAKKYNLALKNFQECLKLDPHNAEVHYNLGVLYQYEYGDRVSAIYHLKRYLELNPQAKDKKEIEFLIELLGE